MEVKRRFFQPPTTSYLLFGSRGTGKSTFLREMYPTALWIDLLKPDSYRTYLARPERLSINGIPCIPCDQFLQALHPDTDISF